MCIRDSSDTGCLGPTNMNINDFYNCLNYPNMMSGCQSCSGRLFHSVGPAVAKQRSPNWLFDLLTKYVWLLADRGERASYCSEGPCMKGFMEKGPRTRLGPTNRDDLNHHLINWCCRVTTKKFLKTFSENWGIFYAVSKLKSRIRCCEREMLIETNVYGERHWSFIQAVVFDVDDVVLCRLFPFLPDWIHGLSDHLTFLFCSTAGFVCMLC